MNTPNILRAVRFVTVAHGDQKRKYSGAPYIVHPLEVAGVVATVLPDDEDAIIAAILHDVVEDTPVTIETILVEFGHKVALMVEQLTDLPKGAGNRAFRKAATRERLAKASNVVKTIKIVDILNNMVTIVEFDPKFAKVFVGEIRELLPSLKGADPGVLGDLEFAVKYPKDCSALRGLAGVYAGNP